MFAFKKLPKGPVYQSVLNNLEDFVHENCIVCIFLCFVNLFIRVNIFYKSFLPLIC